MEFNCLWRCETGDLIEKLTSEYEQEIGSHLISKDLAKVVPAGSKQCGEISAETSFTAKDALVLDKPFHNFGSMILHGYHAGAWTASDVKSLQLLTPWQPCLEPAPACLHPAVDFIDGNVNLERETGSKFPTSKTNYQGCDNKVQPIMPLTGKVRNTRESRL